MPCRAARFITRRLGVQLLGEPVSRVEDMGPSEDAIASSVGELDRGAVIAAFCGVGFLVGVAGKRSSSGFVRTLLGNAGGPMFSTDPDADASAIALDKPVASVNSIAPLPALLDRFDAGGDGGWPTSAEMSWARIDGSVPLLGWADTAMTFPVGRVGVLDVARRRCCWTEVSSWSPCRFGSSDDLLACSTVLERALPLDAAHAFAASPSHSSSSKVLVLDSKPRKPVRRAVKSASLAMRFCMSSKSLSASSSSLSLEGSPSAACCATGFELFEARLWDSVAVTLSPSALLTTDAAAVAG